MSEESQKYIDKFDGLLTVYEYRPDTVKRYIYYMNKFFQWMEESVPKRDITDISYDDIIDYIIYLRTVLNYKGNTVQYYLSAISAFHQFVLRRPLDKRLIPHIRYDNPLPKVPTLEEVKFIIDSIDDLTLLTEVVLMYSAGLRVSEVSRLHYKDIDRKSEDERFHCIHVSPSKNRDGRNAILSKSMISILSQYVWKVHPGSKPQDWIFPGRKSGEHICPESITKAFHSHMIKIGWLDKEFNTRSLRHAFALHLYDSGVDLVTLKEALGHKNISSTEIYVRMGIGNGKLVTSPFEFDIFRK